MKLYYKLPKRVLTPRIPGPCKICFYLPAVWDETPSNLRKTRCHLEKKCPDRTRASATLLVSLCLSSRNFFKHQIAIDEPLAPANAPGLNQGLF